MIESTSCSLVLQLLEPSSQLGMFYSLVYALEILNHNLDGRVG
jgi:hypothetical protein